MKFERLAKDGVTSIVVGRITVDVHIRRWRWYRRFRGLFPLSDALGAMMPSLTPVHFHAFGVTVDSGSGDKEEKGETKTRTLPLPSKMKLEFRLVSGDQRTTCVHKEETKEVF